jgi:hypothetical protein
MSLALDLFILLDTVRIILRGATYAAAPAEPAAASPIVRAVSPEQPEGT